MQLLIYFNLNFREIEQNYSNSHKFITYKTFFNISHNHHGYCHIVIIINIVTRHKIKIVLVSNESRTGWAWRRAISIFPDTGLGRTSGGVRTNVCRVQMIIEWNKGRLVVLVRLELDLHLENQDAIGLDLEAEDLTLKILKANKNGFKNSYSLQFIAILKKLLFIKKTVVIRSRSKTQLNCL